MSTPKTILMTGATGFLGSNILKLLLLQSYKVLVVKRASSNTERIKEVLSSPHLILYNLDDGFGLEDLFKKHRVDVIVHTATVYGRLSESTLDIVKSNLLLPLRLLELAVAHKTPCFINTDTFSSEDIELLGKEKQYVKTKKDFVTYAKEIIADTPVTFVNLVIEQMYGPTDNPTKFIPFVIKEMLKNSPTVSFTPGQQKRDFIFVEDCAQAYLSVIKHLSALDRFEEFGIGTGMAHPLKSAVTEIKSMLKSVSQLRWGALPYRENEIMEHCADISRNKKIAWKAETSFKEGMRKTIGYYRHTSV